MQASQAREEPELVLILGDCDVIQGLHLRVPLWMWESLRCPLIQVWLWPPGQQEPICTPHPMRS